MPRRSFLTYSVGALLFAAAAVRGATDVAIGTSCTNIDTCVSGAICSANVCIVSDEGGILKNGVGNSCSASDCCPTGTTCADVLGIVACLDSTAVTPSSTFTTIECTGQTNNGTDPTTNSTVPIITDPTTNGTIPIINATDPTTNTTVPPPIDPSVPIVNGTDPNVNTTIPEVPPPTSTNSTNTTGTLGLGESCSATECCSSDYVCYKYGSICGPFISDALTLACGATNDSSVPNGSRATCNNRDACANDETCVNNVCIDTQGIAIVNGIGNTCSADDCCANNLACMSSSNRCAPAASSLGTITCAATGGLSSGEEVGPSGVGSNDNGNSASAIVAMHPIASASVLLVGMIVSTLLI